MLFRSMFQYFIALFQMSTVGNGRKEKERLKKFLFESGPHDASRKGSSESASSSK